MKIKTNCINGKTVLNYHLNDEMYLCGNQMFCNSDHYMYIQEPLCIDKLSNSDLMQDILYNIHYDWSILDALCYLNTLIDLITKNKEIKYIINIFDKSLYQPIHSANYSRTYNCEIHGCKRVLIDKEYTCKNCSDIDLGDCAVCPIASGCTVCNAKSKGSCLMHQAEAIACIYFYNSSKKGNYYGYIPFSWASKFGDEIYNLLSECRGSNSRYFISTGQSNLNIILSLHVNDNESVLYDILNRQKISYKIINIDNRINFDITTDYETFISYIKPIIMDSWIVGFKEGVTGCYDVDHYTTLISTTINDISFSLGNESTITDIISTSPGSPFNPFTRAMIQYMKPYINQGSSVLDLGCGKGTLLLCANLYGAIKMTGIDISDQCITDTHNMISLNIDQNNMTNFNIIKEDIFKLINNTDQRFDIVLGNLSFQMQTKIIPIISKILNPGGIYIAGGFNLLTEYVLEQDTINQSDMEIIDRKFLYSVEIIILKERNNGIIH